MEKKEKSLFLRSTLIIFILIISSASYFMYKVKISSPTLTGYSIQGQMYEIYAQMPVGPKIFLLSQWVLIMIIIAYAVFKGILIKTQKDDSTEIDMKQMQENSKTDLDTLYNILKHKKKIKISTIAKLFSIKKETAMEWSDILESGGIAKVEFPALGEPTLEIIE
jgi:hypothetical protein